MDSTHIPMHEGTLGVHHVELMVNAREHLQEYVRMAKRVLVTFKNARRYVARNSKPKVKGQALRPISEAQS